MNRDVCRSYTHAWILAGSLALTACGPMQETMPEPAETGRVAKLSDVLGKNAKWSDRIWSSISGKPLERADGLVFNDWIRRRAATLAGTITVDHERADHNPGSVKETLAWERAARDKDFETRKAIASYNEVLGKMRKDCPLRIEYEDEWQALYAEAYAKGEDRSRPNWGKRALDLVLPCQDEKNEPAAPPVSETLPAAPVPASTPSGDASFTPEETAMIDVYLELNSQCRGSSDLKVQDRACPARNAMLEELNDAGICWGREDEAAYQNAAHRCGPGSLSMSGSSN